MQTFVYPRDYLKIKGNVQHCWEVHKSKMKSLGLPYVGYSAFSRRLHEYGWDLYRAIHTPLNYDKLEWDEKAKVKIRTLRFRFIYLFKADDRRGRSKRY